MLHVIAVVMVVAVILVIIGFVCLGGPAIAIRRSRHRNNRSN